MQNKTFRSLRGPLILKKYVLELSWAHFDCHLQEGNLGRFNHSGSTEQNSPVESTGAWKNYTNILAFSLTRY